MSMADEVLSALEAITGEPAVREDLELRLFDLQLLDSLRTIELLVALSERCGVDLAPAEIDREIWATPASIIAFMEGRIPQ
jgi:D-alanine--poly(phosphoribitol) ligase subunit 2